MRGMMRIGCVVIACLVFGCSGDDSSDPIPCATPADCPEGYGCLFNNCVEDQDTTGGGGSDAGTSGGTGATTGGGMTSDCDRSAETCDGQDNDCDGEVDEGVTEPCSSVCGGGVRQCLNGTFGACSAREPVEELCNRLDDDCDGTPDEDFNLDEPCMVGEGECARRGTPACNPDGTVRCEGDAGAPTNERCDGLDNDCNGLVDDPFGGGAPCFAGQGECQRSGLTLCRLDSMGEEVLYCSEAAGQPQEEICGDGLDNDCDGMVDDGC